MTTLDNSFCRPTNEELGQIMTPLKMSADENHVLVAYTINGKKHKFYRRWVDVADIGLTEIPVSRFLDLYHDRITPWRLEEVGFSGVILDIDGDQFCVPHKKDYALKIGMAEIGVRIEHNKFLAASMSICDGNERSFMLLHGITTFTELLQQIKFLTPPQK